MPIPATRRAALPASSFAYPKTRRYPIDTPARARNALARAAQPANRGSYPTVAKAVRAKWGNTIATVGTRTGSISTPGPRGINTARGNSTARRKS